MKGAGAPAGARTPRFVGYGDGVLKLSLDAGFDYLRSDRSPRPNCASAAGGQARRAAPRVVFDHARRRVGNAAAAQPTASAMSARAPTKQNFMNNPDVQRLIQQHGARLVPDSIRPFDE